MISKKSAFGLACGALLILLLLFFHSAVFGGKIQGQFDHLFSFYPWKAHAGPDFVDQNPLLSDQALTLIPFYKQVHAQLSDGIPPLWNHNSMGGTPLVGNYSASLYYPLYWPYYLTGSDSWLVWIGISKLLFCGIFTYLFLRIIGLSRLSGFCGAVAFMLCGFNIVWLFHQHVKISIFLPCLFYLIELALQTGKRRPFLFLAGAVGIQFMGGHMETSLHVLSAASLYFLVRLFQLGDLKQQRFSLFGKYVITLVIGAVLASCQLIPFFEYLFNSSMLHQRSLLTPPEFFTFEGLGFRLKLFFTFLVSPNHFGNPLDGTYEGLLNYNEINGAYIGILPVLLAVVSFFLRRKTGVHKFMILLCLLSSALIVQLPLLYPLVKRLPGFSMSNSLRMLLILGFANAVLASFALDRILKWVKHAKLRPVIFVVALAVICVDLFHFGARYNPTVEPDVVYPPTETTDFLRKDPDLFRFSGPLDAFPHETHLPYHLTSARGYDAIEIRTYTEFMGLLSSHENARLFIFATPYYDRRDSTLFDLLNTKYFITVPEEKLDTPGLTQVYAGETNIYLNESCMPRAFLVSAYRVEKDKEKRLALLADPAFSPRDTLVLEEDVDYEPRLITGSTAEITEYQPNRVEIRANAVDEAFLVLTDNHFPGWEARVNGEPAPILRAYHTFRAVRVPRGESRITFLYRPWSFYIGICLTLAAAAFIMWRFISGKSKRIEQE